MKQGGDVYTGLDPFKAARNGALLFRRFYNGGWHMGIETLAEDVFARSKQPFAFLFERGAPLSTGCVPGQGC